MTIDVTAEHVIPLPPNASRRTPWTGATGFHRLAAPLPARQVRAARRIRERWTTDPEVTEKHMFGGVAFLYRGNMALGVTGDDLMVRVGPDTTDTALARPGTRVFDMTGRPMRGWIVVDGAAVAEDDALAAWLDEGREPRPSSAAGH